MKINYQRLVLIHTLLFLNVFIFVKSANSSHSITSIDVDTIRTEIILQGNVEISKTIVIAYDGVVSIFPGTKINFLNASYLKVLNTGKLLVRGLANDSVFFVSSADTSGIFIESNVTEVAFSYASFNGKLKIEGNNAKMKFSDSRFLGVGINTTKSIQSMYNCNFSGIEGITNTKDLIIEGCLFKQCDSVTTLIKHSIGKLYITNSIFENNLVASKTEPAPKNLRLIDTDNSLEIKIIKNKFFENHFGGEGTVINSYKSNLPTTISENEFVYNIFDNSRKIKRGYLISLQLHSVVNMNQNYLSRNGNVKISSEIEIGLLPNSIYLKTYNTLTFSNNSILENINGNGIFFESGKTKTTVISNKIIGNDFGFLIDDVKNASVKNNVFASNSVHCTQDLLNTNFSNNTLDIYERLTLNIFYSSYLNYSNSTVFNNYFSKARINSNSASASAIVNYNLIGNAFASGATSTNPPSYVSIDPLFVNPVRFKYELLSDSIFNRTLLDSLATVIEKADYRVRPNSPLIDAGWENTIIEKNETDVYENARILNGRIDIGASESIFGNQSKYSKHTATVNPSPDAKFLLIPSVQPAKLILDLGDDKYVYTDSVFFPNPLFIASGGVEIETMFTEITTEEQQNTPNLLRSYVYKVSDEYYCTSYDTLRIFLVGTDIENHSTNNTLVQMFLKGNQLPAQLKIISSLPINTNSQLLIYNLRGESLKAIHIPPFEEEISVELDNRTMQRGIYLLRFVNAVQEISQKVIIF